MQPLQLHVCLCEVANPRNPICAKTTEAGEAKPRRCCTDCRRNCSVIKLQHIANQGSSRSDMSAILRLLGLGAREKAAAEQAYNIANNPFRAKRTWPPDFSKLSQKHQFRLERRYRRRAKLKWARPTWVKTTKLAQWGIILFVVTYGVLFMEVDKGKTPFDGVCQDALRKLILYQYPNTLNRYVNGTVNRRRLSGLRATALRRRTIPRGPLRIRREAWNMYPFLRLRTRSHPPLWLLDRVCLDPKPDKGT